MVFDLVYIFHVIYEPEFWVAVSSICFFIPLVFYIINVCNSKADKYINSVTNNYQRSNILIIETSNDLLLARNKVDNFHFTKYIELNDKADADIDKFAKDCLSKYENDFQNYCNEKFDLLKFFSKKQIERIKSSFISRAVYLSECIIRRKINKDYHNMFIYDSLVKISSFFNKNLD